MELTLPVLGGPGGERKQGGEGDHFLDLFARKFNLYKHCNFTLDAQFGCECSTPPLHYGARDSGVRMTTLRSSLHDEIRAPLVVLLSTVGAVAVNQQEPNVATLSAAEEPLRCNVFDVSVPTLFAVTAVELAALTVPGREADNLAALAALGGGQGIARRLHVDPDVGLSADPTETFTDRTIAFGINVFPCQPYESWIALFTGCFEDVVLLVLVASAIVSLVIGSIEHPSTGWIDGLAIMIAVLLVATVTATNDYQKQLQFRALAAVSDARVEVQVLRGGARRVVGVPDIVVGDVIHIESGSRLPADGVVLRSQGLKTNESALTGESNDIAKDAYGARSGASPLLLSGSQVCPCTPAMVFRCSPCCRCCESDRLH